MPEHDDSQEQQVETGAAADAVTAPGFETGAVSPGPAPRARLTRATAAAFAVVGLASAAAGVLGAHELWTSSATTAAPAIGGLSSNSSNSSGSSSATPFPGYGGSGFQLPGGRGYGGEGSASTGATVSSALTAKVDPGLVNINTTLGYSGGKAAGTGVVLSSDGEVLTNNHVIDGATKITATDVGNGKTYTATVVGYDPTSDIAVLQLSGASGLKTADLGDSSSVKVGDSVIGIGNAGGVGGTPSAAAGSITALNQSITAQDDFGGESERLTGLLQTNAGIQPGDSGGPLVNSNGEVLGIDTAGSQSYSFNTSGTQAYAIPINTAVTLAKQIESGQSSSTIHLGATAFLGISAASPQAGRSNQGGFGYGYGQGATSTPTVPGITVAAVVAGKPAATAGIVAGDTLTSFNGKTLRASTNLSTLLIAVHPGDTVKLGWTDSAGQTHSASVKLASGPAA